MSTLRAGTVALGLAFVACDPVDIHLRHAALLPCPEGDATLGCPEGTDGSAPGDTTSAGPTGPDMGAGSSETGGGDGWAPASLSRTTTWVVDNDECQQGSSRQIGSDICVTVGCWPHTTGKMLQVDYCVYDEDLALGEERRRRVWEAGHRLHETTLRVFEGCTPISVLDGDDCVRLVEQLDKMGERSCEPKLFDEIELLTTIRNDAPQAPCTGSAAVGAVTTRQIFVCGTSYPYTCTVTDCSATPRTSSSVEEKQTLSCILSL